MTPMAPSVAAPLVEELLGVGHVLPHHGWLLRGFSLIDPAANVDLYDHYDALFLLYLEESPVITDAKPVDGILDPDEISGMRKMLQFPEMFTDSIAVGDFLEVFLGFIMEKNLVGHNFASF